MRDAVSQQATLQQVHQQSEFQQLLMDLAVGFVNTPLEQLDEAIDAALSRTGAFVGADRAYVFRYDLDERSTSNTHEWCARGVDPQIHDLQHVPFELVPDWVATHLRGESMHVPDVQQLPPDSGVRQILEPQGVVTLIALPIATAGECFGFVGFDVVTGRRDWTDTEHQLLRVLAELFANAELRRRYEQQLVAAREQAEVASEAKTRFLSTISHELRTPMAGVLGMTELLLDEDLDDRQRTYVTAARDAASGLLLLVGDLLDIARIEQRRLELVDGPTDLPGLFDGVVTTARVAAERRGLTISLVADPALPAQVLIDGARVRQIVTNLVGNAVRFTDRGSVSVSATRGQREDDGAPLLRIEVADTGVGIPADRQDEVFEPFSQVDPTTTRRVDGSGLGLTIVRELVGLLDGAITLDSTPGVGTRVIVELPLREVADQTVARPTAPTTVRAGLRVLVAEDNAINQEVMRGYLREVAARVEVVADGQAAVDAACAGGFDAVLMDCYMPGMDGPTATRTIRAHQPPTSQVPIVAVTADGARQHRTACLAAGMNAVLVKPFDRASLLAVLAEVAPAAMPRHRATAVDDGASGAATPDDATIPAVFDPAPLRAMAGRTTPDGPLATRLLALFAEHAPGDVADLMASVQPFDAPGFRVAAHTLKSNAATLGLERLRDACTQAEARARSGIPADDSVVRLAARVAAEFDRATEALEQARIDGTLRR